MGRLLVPANKTHTLQRQFEITETCKKTNRSFSSTVQFAYFFGYPCFLDTVFVTHYFFTSHELYEQAYNYILEHCSDVLKEKPISKLHRESFNGQRSSYLCGDKSARIYKTYDNLSRRDKNKFLCFEGSPCYAAAKKPNVWKVPKRCIINNMNDFKRRLMSIFIGIHPEGRNPRVMCEECSGSFNPLVYDRYYVRNTYNLEKLTMNQYLHPKHVICEDCYSKKSPKAKSFYFLAKENIPKTMYITFVVDNKNQLRPDLQDEEMHTRCVNKDREWPPF